jgi:octopine/nopaline transport system substrate-binding protein
LSLRFLRKGVFTLLPVLAAAALALAQAAEAKDWSKITIATTSAFMPFNGLDAYGEPVGYEIDLANDLCARMKATCTIVGQDWESLISGLNAGEYDAIMAAMSITPKRLKAIDFSRAYAQLPSTFAVPKNSALAKMPVTRVSLDDVAATEALVKELTPYLEGKSLGVQSSTIQADMLNTYFKGVAARIRIYRTSGQAVLDLESGKLDAVMQLTSYFASALPEPVGDQLVLTGPLMTGGLLGHGIGVGLRKGDADLKDRFDKAIAEAQADGTLKRLTLQWFKTDISPPN